MFQYVQDRAESETETPLDAIAALSQRIEQLERTIATLSCPIPTNSPTDVPWVVPGIEAGMTVAMMSHGRRGEMVT